MSLKLGAEVKLESDPCVVDWDNSLVVGAEDGSIHVSNIVYLLTSDKPQPSRYISIKNIFFGSIYLPRGIKLG